MAQGSSVSQPENTVHRPGVLSVALAFSAVTYGCGPDAGSGPRPACTLPSYITQSAIKGERNVLSAIVSATLRDADSVIVRYGAESLTESTPASTPLSGDIRVTVLGLSAGTSYSARLTAFNSCGSIDGEQLEFTTGPLPADLPSYASASLSPDSGYIVFAAGKYGIVIDNTARVVWYHRFANGPGLNFQAQPNGRYVARPNPDPGKIGSWIEIDPAGDTTRVINCADGLQPRMHDMIAATDGSYWLLCDEIRTMDLTSHGRSSAVRVMGTQVQHVSSSGQLLFSWSPFDNLTVDLSALDLSDAIANPVNWTHGNAIDLDPDGNVLVSYRNLSEVLKIDPRTSSVLWKLGGNDGSMTLENSSSPPFVHQHGVRAVNGTGIVLLDNLGESDGSRAERYEIDGARRTARLVSAFSSSASLVAQIGGSTQIIGQHVLVSFGNGGGVEEYDATGHVAWKLAGSPGYVFRAQRIRSLYQPGVGDPR